MTSHSRRTLRQTARAALPPVINRRAATHQLTIKGMACNARSLDVAAGDTFIVTNRDSPGNFAPRVLPDFQAIPLVSPPNP